MIKIGDYAEFNSDTAFGTHLYEDRIFKMSSMVIENHASTGHCAIILYNTVMGIHSRLGDLSLLMKGEQLPAYSYWNGSPAQATKRYIY